jgi:MFS family permease
LAFGTLLLLGGRIGDRVGRKRTLIIGLVGFAVASAIGGASVNFSMLVIARTVQGAFGALLAPSVLAILTTTFTDPDERGKAFGIYGAVAGAGGALGLLFGGLLTSYASWRWTLFINLAFAFGAIAGTVLWFKNDQGADNDPFDLPGLLLVGVGLFSLVFGFSHAETTAWSDPFTVAFLVVGVVALGVFAVFETKAKFPLLGLRRGLRRVLVLDLLLAGHVGVQPSEDRHLVPSSHSSRDHYGPGVQSHPVAAIWTKADRPGRVAPVGRRVVRTSPGRTAYVVPQSRASLSPRDGSWVGAEHLRCL